MIQVAENVSPAPVAQPERLARLIGVVFTPAADADEAMRQVVGEVLAARA